jgi:hypothetical protein
VLFPVFDMLANNMIGDNPALVEELRWVALHAVCCTMHEGWVPCLRMHSLEGPGFMREIVATDILLARGTFASATPVSGFMVALL